MKDYRAAITQLEKLQRMLEQQTDDIHSARMEELAAELQKTLDETKAKMNFGAK